MPLQTIFLKSCAVGVALLFSLSGKSLPIDSLKKKGCVCEIYQAIADREYQWGLKPVANIQKVDSKTKKFKRTLFPGRNRSRKPERRRVRTDRFTRCWK